MKPPAIVILALLARGLLLTAAASSTQAASVTLENQGAFVASFELEGCGKKINVGDIPFLQSRTVDLAEFPCADGDKVDLRLFYHWWGWKLFAAESPRTQPPKSFTKVKSDIWLTIQGDITPQNITATRGNIDLTIDNVAWDPYINSYYVSKDLSGADLSETNLRGVFLKRANLAGAELDGADLTGAFLFYANLAGTSLIRTNLSQTILYGANLQRANLEGANLVGAQLEAANLRDAMVTGAQLSGSITGPYTTCPDGRKGPC